MGLRGTIAAAVNSAFVSLGDIPSSATYRRTVTTYVPSTGDSTTTVTDTVLPVVFLRFTEIELARIVGLQVTDRKAILKQSDLAITPNIPTDTIIDGTRSYNIVSFNPDPAAATWTLQLRAP